MRLLITGGTGYLGSRLVKSLLLNNHEIMCVKRQSSKIDYLSDVINKLILVNSDDIDLGVNINIFKPNIIIHTACIYERGNNSFFDIYEGNLEFPIKILKYAIESGATRWINTSTSLSPYMNMYSLSKYQFSEWGRYFSRTYNIDFINLKLEHFYGENGPKSHFITWVISKLMNGEPLDLTDGTQKRDFIYSGDLEKIYNKLINLALYGYHDLPVGTGVSPTIREVVEYLHRITHSNSKLNFGVLPMRQNEHNSSCDTTQLKKLGLECSVSWKDGMNKILGAVYK